MLAAAALAAAAPAAEVAPPLDPIAFFTGATRGAGRLSQLFKDERRLAVDSVGTLAEDGRLVLVQRIMLEGAAPRVRRWEMRAAGPGRWTGTLTDAAGPVETVAVGPAIRIRYAMKGGMRVEQWLRARPGGRVVDNRLTVRKWGVRVARLEETIVRR